MLPLHTFYPPADNPGSGAPGFFVVVAYLEEAACTKTAAPYTIRPVCDTVLLTVLTSLISHLIGNAGSTIGISSDKRDFVICLNQGINVLSYA